MIAGALGWIGSMGTFVAYMLLLRGRINSSSLKYSAMNAAGGFLCGASAILYHAWPSVASNAIWAGLAAYTVAVELRDRARRGAPVLVLRINRNEKVTERAALELAS